MTTRGSRRPPSQTGSSGTPRCAAALVSDAAVMVGAAASLIRGDARPIDAIRELYRAERRLDDASRALLGDFLRRALGGEPPDVEGALAALRTVANWRAPAEWRVD